MISQLLKPIPFYVKVSTNCMDVIRLDNNEQIVRDAVIPFSNDRIVFAQFFEAEALLRAILVDLVGKRAFTPRLKIVVQQMERIEGGLSSVERRAMVDSCEHAGAFFIRIVEHDRPLSIAEALATLNRKEDQLIQL